MLMMLNKFFWFYNTGVYHLVLTVNYKSFNKKEIETIERWVCLTENIFTMFTFKLHKQMISGKILRMVPLKNVLLDNIVTGKVCFHRYDQKTLWDENFIKVSNLIAWYITLYTI